jgi:hypothetical protein
MSSQAPDESDLKETQKLLSKLSLDSNILGIRFDVYKDESDLDHVMNLVGNDLSEPYSSKCMCVMYLEVAGDLVAH